MPGVVIERPKMTKNTYQALKKHVMKEREKKKQDEEQGKAMEKLREERAKRQKKAQEDHSNLEKITEQIDQLEAKKNQLKAEKHEVFCELKKMLAQEEEDRKRMKEKSEMPIGQYGGGGVQSSMYLQGANPVSQRPQYMTQGGHGGRPLMQMQAMKRPRSPSPPPQRSVAYPTYPGRQHPAVSASYASVISSKAEPYSAASASTNTQPGSHSQLPTAVVGPMDRGGAMDRGGPPVSLSAAGTAQYPAAAFPSYYPSAQQQSQHQQQQQALGELFSQGARASPHQNPYPRMPQPPRVAGYTPLALQQQLEHASHQSGFPTEDRHKATQQGLRGLPPSHQTAAAVTGQHKGGITTGYPVRTQPSASNYQPPSQHRGGY